MRTLTSQEKRTVRIGGVLLAGYLALFYGVRVWKHLEARRASYANLVMEAHKLKQELRPYENKSLLIEELRQKYRMAPSKLSKATLVAEASAAIQKSATTTAVQLGPLRESSARSSAKELASMQLEAVGQVPALTAFIHRLETLGYPLVIDSLQITPDPARPGAIKMNLVIIILDFDQWKTEDRRHA